MLKSRQRDPIQRFALKARAASRSESDLRDLAKQGHTIINVAHQLDYLQEGDVMLVLGEGGKLEINKKIKSKEADVLNIQKEVFCGSNACYSKICDETQWGGTSCSNALVCTAFVLKP